MATADTQYPDRRRAVASEIAEQDIDSVLVTHITHVRYLSGFSGSNAALLLNKDHSARISTDGRYTTQIAEEVPDIDCILGRPCADTVLKEITGPRRVGYEADYLTVTEYERLQQACGEGVELVPVRGIIEKSRLVKDSGELDGLRSIAALASQAYEDMLAAGEVAVGRTERDIAADLEYRMRKLGAERPSFDSIVASGPNSAKPHHGADDRVIKAGELVTIDFGAYATGGNSDMTRTKEIYDTVLQAQLAGVKVATPGTSLRDVDRACRDIIKAAGYGDYFVHSTGHGIGLDVHELPYAATTGSGELAEGMTLTIEPGIYVPGKGGVRIEDTLIITSGEPEIITKVSKELRVV